MSRFIPLRDDAGEHDLLVHARGLGRAFGGVKAVTDVDLDIARGEVVGVMGPNGAGKSTLLSLIAGVRRPTSGLLRVAGRDMSRLSPGATARMGVGLAHQIPKPFRNLTVAQNISVASQVLPLSKRRAAVTDAIELSGLGPKAASPAGELGLLELKRLELARVLALDPQLVLLDEVAAGLTGADLDQLISLVATIRDSGRTILMVEHVQEVLHQLSTRVVVLEWGKKLTEGTPAEVSSDPRVIEIYLGPEAETTAAPARKNRDGGAPLLSVQGLSSSYGPIPVLRDVNLDVAPGEILVVLGANGAGKTTLAKTLQGTLRARSGAVTFQGKDITTLSSHRRVRSGISLVPEGRRLFGDLTVRENLELGLQTAGDLTPLDRVYDLFPKLRELGNRQAGVLSGGEQQMVAIGRALASQPKLIMFDELSLGLAPVIVERLLEAVRQIADWGTAVVLIEQNVHRALTLADQVLVLRQGRAIYSGSPDDFTESDLQAAYLGAEAS